MTCRGGSSRGNSGPQSGRRRRSAVGRSRAARVRPCGGRSRTGPRIITRRASAHAAEAWRTLLTWGSPGRSAGGDPGRVGGAGAARPAPGTVRLRPGACRGAPGGRAVRGAVHRAAAACAGCIPGRLPACPGGAVPGPDRRCRRHRSVDRVHPFVPGEGGGPGRGRGAADPRPDHRRRSRRVRRDHAAVRPGRGEEVCAWRVHRGVLRLLARRAQPGVDAARRHPPGLRRDRGLRPVPELLPPVLGARRREPGVPGSHPAQLPGLRRDLPRRHLARAYPAGAARPDPCLARRPQAGAFRHPRPTC